MLRCAPPWLYIAHIYNLSSDIRQLEIFQAENRHECTWNPSILEFKNSEKKKISKFYAKNPSRILKYEVWIEIQSEDFNLPEEIKIV